MFLHKEKVKPPRSLRSARLSVVKNQISTPVIQTSTNSPKKVIKALYDYNAQSPNELSFARGDFFLVTGREGDTSFYEAFNPITNSRGIVPVPYFQVLEKHEKAMVDSVQKKDLYSEAQQPKPQPLYGIVLYDFQAERSDELDAKAGEPIIIIAQSNAEWFVAKPIGRLGGPGLIPVSFVDIRDASTGRTVKNDLMQAPSSSVFPNVEDWKKQTQGYEASSISIGKMERQMQQISIEEEEIDPVDDYYDMKDHHQNPDALLDNYGMTHLVNTSSSSILDSPVPASSTSSRRGAHEEGAIVVSAYIDSHILEGDQYWFIVFAKLANGRHRVLYRLYEDFYDFQINFLQEFPAEAGKQDQARILPYMPGPLDAVNDDITGNKSCC
ncbi:bud emergence protein 1, variant 2 [Mucor circinelloides]